MSTARDALGVTIVPKVKNPHPAPFPGGEGSSRKTLRVPRDVSMGTNSASGGRESSVTDRLRPDTAGHSGESTGLW